MSWEQHRIGKQRLEVQLASEELAIQLQSQLPELNRQRILPAIERVLGEFDLPGQQIRIGSLNLDLGTIAANDLEREMPERLERELRGEIQRAIGASDTVARSGRESQFDLVEQYLVTGTVPFWAPKCARVFVRGSNYRACRA